jgi:tetratricopeptide (TPR) repeat protein
MSKRKKSFDKRAPRVRSGNFFTSALPLGVPAGAALIAVAAFFVYLPSLSGGFIWDDHQLLTDNNLIKAPDGLYRFWCTTETPDYWPVTNTTFWIEWRLWGMNSSGAHVTNLILHVIESLLIWIILRRLSIPGAFLAAVIFALHPVNVESVAWIAQRKNLMAMLFFLLSILWYLKDLHSSRHTPCAVPAHGVCGLLTCRWYWLSFSAFVLAMLSKGSVVVLPVLLLGIVWFLRPMGTVPIFLPTKMGLSASFRRDLLRTAPFFAIAVVLTAVNVWFQRHGSGEVIRNAGFMERLLGAGGVVWFYLYKAIVPLNLAFIYPQWRIEAGNPLWWLPLAATLAFTAVLWRYRKTWSRPILFAWAFFCAALVPVMGLTDVFFMRYSLVADHYQHVALIPVIALLSAGYSLWHRRARSRTYRAATVLAVAAVGILAFLTWRQSELYRDEITLLKATLEKNPNSWMAHNNLGIALSQQGLLTEALDHFQQSLKLNPDYPQVHNNLGAALLHTDRRQEAIEHFHQALRLNPHDHEAQYHLGNVSLEEGRLQEAIDYFRQALSFKPDYLEARNNLGVALARAGRPGEAIEQYEAALALAPDFLDAQFNLGKAFKAMGQPRQAIEHFKKALELARSQGQTALAGQIEDWLNSYRSGLSDGPGTQPPSKSLPPSP